MATHHPEADRSPHGPLGDSGFWPTPRLARLRDLDDVAIADGAPDIRGWPVYSADGRGMGRVHSLIADPTALRVRYLDIRVGTTAAITGDMRHILVPVGLVWATGDHDAIIVWALHAADFAHAPPYDHRPVTRDVEDAVRRYYGQRVDPDPWRGVGRGDYYAHPFFDDASAFGPRRRDRAAEPYLTRRRRPELPR